MNASKSDRLADTLAAALTSPNVSDANGEAANIVDTLDDLARAVWFGVSFRSDPRTRPNAMEAHGEAIKEAATTIASAIHDLASAIRERHD